MRVYIQCYSSNKRSLKEQVSTGEMPLMQEKKNITFLHTPLGCVKVLL